MLWGCRDTSNKYYWHVWGVLTVYGPHWVCPRSQQHVLSRSTLLRLQRALQGTVQSGPCACALPRSKAAQIPRCSAGAPSKVSPVCCALHKSKPLRFRLLGTPQGYRLCWACVLCTFPVGAVQVTRCLVSALSQVPMHLNHFSNSSHSVSQVRHESSDSGMLCVSSEELISGGAPPGRCQPSRIPGRCG